MNPSFYQQICDLFQQALALPESERSPFLEKACEGQPTLHHEITKWLQADQDFSRLGQIAPLNIRDLLNRVEADSNTIAEGAPLDFPTPPLSPGPGNSSALPLYVGNHKILSRISRGGQGVVYRARHVGLNRLVALKMILHSDHATEDERERFDREARAIAALQHPNIVQIYEIGEQNGLPFFSMELVEGGNLARKLSGAPLPPQEAAALVETLAHAIQAAHQQGVIHRDLKPANVLLTANGTPKVTDFGLAKKLDEVGHTQSGAILGTPGYLAPEQAQSKGHPITPATDVYALGAILYECLTGRPPFQGATILEALAQVLEQEPVPPRQLNPHIPRDLETICLKCLQKAPHKRYSSAVALAEDLHRFQQGQPISARPTPRWERAIKWVKRHPTTAGLLSLIMVSLLAGIGVSTWFALSEKKARQSEANRAREEQKAKAIAQQQREKYLRQYYLSDMRLAHEDWKGNNLKRMRELLNRHGPKRDYEEDLRGFEWHYLNRLAHFHLLELKGHDRGVTSVAFHPDSKLIVSGSYDQTVKVWDASTGEEMWNLKAHLGPVTSVAFSPDGRWIASGSQDRTIKLWSAVRGEDVLTLKGHPGFVSSLAFTSDGKHIVSGSLDGSVKVWNLSDPKDVLTLKGHTDRITSVALSVNGKWIASGSWDCTLKVWDRATGEEVQTCRSGTDRVYSVAFSPDSERIVSGEGLAVKVWNGFTGRKLLELTKYHNFVTSVAFSPDGRNIVTGSWDMKVRVHNAITGEESFTIQGHTDAVECVAFSPNGKWIASAGDRTVKLWDANQGQGPVTLTGHVAWVQSVAYSPNGKHIISGSGYLLGSDSGEVKVWDAITGKISRSMKGRFVDVLSVAFSPDGKWVAAGSEDGIMRVWHASTGENILTLKGHTDGVRSVAFSPDGRNLVTGSRDRKVKVWNVPSGKELISLSLQGQNDQVRTVAFSPNGKRIGGGGDDRTVSVWSIATGLQSLTLRGHTGPVSSIAFSPNGKHIVSGSWDETVKVWDAVTGEEALTLKGHTSDVISVSFSPDGKRIASGSDDSTIKVWDITTGEEALTLNGHTESVFSVAFSPNGMHIASGSGDTTVKIWDATPRK